MIETYLQHVQSTLSAYSWILSVNVLRSDIEETDCEEILVYRFRLTLKNADLLEIMERVVYSKITGTVHVTTYNYHWQDCHHRLIKRWDNAPHFPHLETFPHHVHVGESNNVYSHESLRALEVLAMIEQEFSKQK